MLSSDTLERIKASFRYRDKELEFEDDFDDAEDVDHSNASQMYGCYHMHACRCEYSQCHAM